MPDASPSRRRPTSGPRAQRPGVARPDGRAPGALVHARGLEVGWTDRPVCAPVTLDLDPGEVLALVGPNGTGKSTLLRTVLGLLEPLAGDLRVLGEEVDERLASFRGGVASVLDDDAWFPGLTAREHLLLTAAGHGVTSTTTAVDAVLDVFGMAAEQDAVPTALSSGQRRRLLLAAAFVRPRRLLVLDEPEARLDTGMRRRLADLLAEEAAAGTGVLLATHDPVLLTALGADAVLLDEHASRRVGTDEAVAAMAELA